MRTVRRSEAIAGVLAVIVCVFVADTMLALTFTTNFGAWYGTASLLTLMSRVDPAYSPSARSISSNLRFRAVPQR